ncbi:glycosyltransferase family protein [Flavobacterium frigoris]|uniref:Glycosyltransferase n=1 Tax=Flavobacterium frigoris TaxID=229204 RepID=A0A1H9QX49_FLAFI|nr:hypothetical protein [Flavobacterium frigoris]SER65036.1 hypothetical protein SAMN05444355_11828 [Flavobacterium frigoris]
MVYVYALCDVYYDSFYLKGLKEVYSFYTFNVDKFPKFRQGVFAVLIEEGDLNIKLIIDSTDSNVISSEELMWCDVYGKVNYNSCSIPEEYSHKIKPIGPSFAIKIWSLPFGIFMFLINFVKFHESISNKREFLANYWRQNNRLPLEAYQSSTSVDNYVFFAGSIWKNERMTNLARSKFIEACKKNSTIVFEGGFTPRNDGDNLYFDNLVVSKRYSLKQYLKNSKRSTIVFNTPAVLSCHGWKLGEFLALGKVIVTTKHINILPADLENNVEVVYVNDIDLIENDVKAILQNKQLRVNLGKNARTYFETYLAPKSVIKKLLYPITTL